MNYELLSKVRDHVAAVGDEGCDMDIYIDNCGTSACLAGWTMILSGYTAADVYRRAMKFDGTSEAGCSTIAENLLGIDGSNLFHLEYWPDRYQEIASDEGQAKAMIAIVDDLIAGSLMIEYDGSMIEVEEEEA